MRPDQMTDKAGSFFALQTEYGCVRGYYRTLNRRKRNRPTNLQICYDRICLWGTKSLEPSNEILNRLHDVMNSKVEYYNALIRIMICRDSCWWFTHYI